jgi:hypothetical protein
VVVRENTLMVMMLMLGMKSNPKHIKPQTKKNKQNRTKTKQYKVLSTIKAAISSNPVLVKN